MADALLQIRGLTKRFGGLTALAGVDLDLARGEVHALIGPNGAGKTTLVHAVSGALRADAGTIALGGRDLTREAMHRRVRAGVARSYQVTNLFREYSALANVSLAVEARGGTVPDEAREVLAQVGLAARADAIAATLSHGEQRRLELALALATRPSVLLLDEPMAGMGPEDSAGMVELIAGLKARATILLVEHDMDAVFRLADRISVLVDGRVIATGSPNEVRANADVRRAYLGEEVA